MRAARLPLLLLPLAVACGDDRHPGDGMPGGSGSIPLDQVAGEIESATCDQIFRCSVADNDVVAARALLGNSATCKTYLGTQSSSFDDVVRAVNAGRLMYDGKKMRACLSRYTTGCYLAQGNLSDYDLLNRCREAFIGAAAVGGPCFRSEECTAGAYCESRLAMPGESRCPGTCQALVPLGGSCNADGMCSSSGGNTDVECFFASSGPNPICIANQRATHPAAENEACGYGAVSMSFMRTFTECAAGLWCTNKNGGVCQKPIALDAVCNDDDDVCVEGAVCLDPQNSGVRHCLAYTIQHHEHDMCSEATLSLCSPLDRLDCVMGSCALVIGDGTKDSMCARGDFSPSCNAGLYCDSSTRTCLDKEPLGVACSSDDECQSGSCEITCADRACRAYDKPL